MKENNIPLAISVLEVDYLNNELETSTIEATEVGVFPFSNNNGVVIVQKFNDCACCVQSVLGLWFCNPFLTKYDVAPLPSNKTILKTTNSPVLWNPTIKEMKNITKSHELQETSKGKCDQYFCCYNNRRMKMKLLNTQQVPENFSVTKDFSCGGKCCNPYTGVVKLDEEVVGRVVESWRLDSLIGWCSSLVTTTVYCKVPYDLQSFENEEFVNKYRINVPYCSFCFYMNDYLLCPCCPNLSLDVHKYKNDADLEEGQDEVFGKIKLANGECCGWDSCVRWYCGRHSNYIVEWEPTASVNDKALLVGSTILFDFLYFDGYGPKLLEKSICLPTLACGCCLLGFSLAYM